ncbi:conserved exported hypothetical protein [Methylocella tundrae]|uniref:Lipoprotein n=1 Tax=Methylocella tundrae TaxID=227605 RepID=A0A8B6M9R5_METTU|nr:hypothetical protein [Methylocella tundrae]VTZ27523.1 conserved exported hypothetical protein [Methylocella tundrae]VTZ51241.1 conserved exported hypothetical protein [Methylocella tundrae]
MSKTRICLFVGAVVITGCIYSNAKAEDPAHTFIDRFAGKPFTTDRRGPSSTRIETNPAQGYIDRVSGATQLVAERVGPGTTSITTDTTQEFIERVSGTHPFAVQPSGTTPPDAAAAH